MGEPGWGLFVSAAGREKRGNENENEKRKKKEGGNDTCPSLAGNILHSLPRSSFNRQIISLNN